MSCNLEVNFGIMIYLGHIHMDPPVKWAPIGSNHRLAVNQSAEIQTEVSLIDVNNLI